VMKIRVKVTNVLKALQKMGVHLCYRILVSGQSSCSYLRELPVNEVKIDRALYTVYSIPIKAMENLSQGGP